MGASNIPGEYVLPAVLHGFREKYQGIAIALTIADTKGIIEKVTANEIELGSVGATEKDSNLKFTKLTTDKLVLIAAADNPWFEQDVVTLEQLVEVPFVLREIGSGTKSILAIAFEWTPVSSIA